MRTLKENKSEDSESSLLFISVIVAAFNRREYLISALQSLRNQNLPSTNFEVIVIKNFKDERIDRFIEDSGFISVLIGEMKVGEMLRCAFSYSKGKVISFLDDDDVFVPDKLEKVLEVFRNFPKCGYYHNHHSVIDSSGTDMPFEVREAPPNALWFENADAFIGKLGKTYRFSPDFNLSCISVARAVVANQITMLDGVLAATDSSLMILSLESKLGVYLDNRRLTKYRIHSSTSATLDKDSLVSGMSARNLKENVLTFQLLYYATEENRLRKIIAQKLVESELKLAIIDGTSSFVIRPIDLLSLIESSIRPTQRYKGLLFVYYVVSRLNRKLGRQMYMASRFSRQKKKKVS